MADHPRQGRAARALAGPGDTGWRVLSEHGAPGARSTPRFVDADGSLFVSVARGAAGEQVLTRFDFATGKPAAEPLVGTPGFDFSGCIVSETPGSRALGVRVRHRRRDHGLVRPGDEGAAEEGRPACCPARVNRINCRRCGQPT